MSRTVTVSVDPAATARLIDEAARIEGVAVVRVSPRASVQPEGDSVEISCSNEALHRIVALLQDRYRLDGEIRAIAFAELTALVVPGQSARMVGGSSEAGWEEMETTIARESNMTPNGILLMVVVGIVAVVGLRGGSLHTVIAAMVIAPGFEPIARIGLGVVSTGRAIRRGVRDFVVGYLAVVAGALAAALFLQAWPSLLGTSYLPPGHLVRFWSGFSGSTIIVSIAAACAGAALIAARRSILTAGVMIALGLVPSLAIAVSEAVRGDWPTALRGAGRWALEVAIVAVASSLVFGWKRLRLHRRRSLI